ncbi:MAG: type IV pilus secretin PilQ [Acidobacteria bacterium]|nr:type IV pilus secretin PilQ [Acidobacteriota bacterium]
MTQAGLLAMLVAGAALLVSPLHATGDGVAGARLVGVSTRVEGRATAVVIETSAPVAYVAAQPDPLTLLVDLRNVTTGSSPFVAKPTGMLADLRVQSVQADDGAPLARIRLTLAKPGKPTVRSRWNTVIVEFGTRLGDAALAPAVAGPDPASAVPQSVGSAPSSLARAETTPAAAVVAVPPATAPAPSPMTQADPSAQGAKKYTGHLISLDFQQADLRAVLRSFTEISGLNVIVDPSINGTVDVVLKEVPWDQALEYILKANKLGYAIENNVVRIAPLAVLAEEETARQKLKDAQAMSGELKVLTRTLSYAKAADLQALVKKTLTQRGDVQMDPRTNTLIISDLPAALEQVGQLLTTLDRPEPQVEVEARIVQTSRDSARALGVQWGLSGKAVPQLGNTTPLTFPNQVALEGRGGDKSQTAQGGTLANAVNLGAAGATTTLGLAMGSVTGAFNLDVALSALERKGSARVLSSPRVMMQNNYEAEMTQGVQIPIQTQANNTVTVTFKDAALTLKVRPQITASNTVIMDVKLENASADFSKAVNGIPPINTQRAWTQVLVNDNDTIVIGGIVISQEQTQNDKVPLMARIPLLGWLFKRDTFSDENRELLIFITPRIRR